MGDSDIRRRSGIDNPASRTALYSIVIVWGVAYPFLPIDIIPNRIPVVGYLDQIAFVALALVATWLLLRGPAGAASALGDGAMLPAWAPGRDIGPARRSIPASWRDTRIAWASQIRRLLLDSFAQIFARPLLRLAIGRWPTAPEIAAFRHAFRRFAPVPPLLRAMASVPAARHQIMRTMLISWLLADETYQGAFRTALGSATPRNGDHLRVWLGPKVTFLHLEKTAGMSVTAVLTAQFHPMQIDPDLRRTFPPHVLTPLPPFLIDRVKRYALVWGHYDLPSIRRLGNDRFVFTMLREPKSRILSLYRYWRSLAAQDVGWNGMNQTILAAQRRKLADFLNADEPEILDYIENFYVRRLTGAYRSGNDADPLHLQPERYLRQALEALDTLDFVGLTEDTDAALKTLALRLGFPAPDSTPRENVTRQPRSCAARDIEDPAVEAALERLTRLDRIVYQAARQRTMG